VHGAARFCRVKGLYEQGYRFATRGLKIPYPKETLFARDWIYEYGLLDELAVNAYWTARYAECVDACDRLLSEGKMPAEMRDRVLKNKNFAISKQQEIAASSSPESGASIKLLQAAWEKGNSRILVMRPSPLIWRQPSHVHRALRLCLRQPTFVVTRACMTQRTVL